MSGRGRRFVEGDVVRSRVAVRAFPKSPPIFEALAPSRPARNERGESRREGHFPNGLFPRLLRRTTAQNNTLLSPSLSSTSLWRRGRWERAFGLWDTGNI